MTLVNMLQSEIENRKPQSESSDRKRLQNMQNFTARNAEITCNICDLSSVVIQCYLYSSRLKSICIQKKNPLRQSGDVEQLTLAHSFSFLFLFLLAIDICTFLGSENQRELVNQAQLVILFQFNHQTVGLNTFASQ